MKELMSIQDRIEAAGFEVLPGRLSQKRLRHALTGYIVFCGWALECLDFAEGQAELLK